MEAEDSIVYKDIYRNAYFVLTGVLSVDDLVEYNGCVLPFEPYTSTKKITVENQNLLHHLTISGWSEVKY